MDAQDLPPLCQLSPELAHHVLGHLSKQDLMQFALCCKHTYICTLTAARALVLSHRCLIAGKASQVRLRTRKCCTRVVVHPRTMDELSKLAALLMVHNVHHLPSMHELHLQLLNVYDKQCDVSLILKSVALHISQLRQLHIEQEAVISLKAMAAAAEVPMLTTLAVKSRHGFEPGALGQLSKASNLTRLHLEVLPDNISYISTIFPMSPAPRPSSSMSPSEMARLHAGDEVGLAKVGVQLLAFATIGFDGPTALPPITALLAAVASSSKPQLCELQLGRQQVSGQTLELITSISSLSQLSLLEGCELTSAMDLSKLSALAGLTQLVVSPLMPPAPVLAALAKGCKHLAALAVSGQPGSQPALLSMTGITKLQLLPGASNQRSSRASGGGTIGGSMEAGMSNLSIAPKSPLCLAGLEAVWPNLVTLEVLGWALDSASVTAIRKLQGLRWLKLQAGRDPGTALHARLLLPLLDKPSLQHLELLELSDLNDDWLGEALHLVTGRSSSGGSKSSVRELHLGAVSEGYSAATPVAAASNGSSSPPAAAAAGGSSGLSSLSSRMITDRGLMKLVGWSRLQKVVLVQLPGISLAGIKALVAGMSMLTEMRVVACPIVSAAPATSIARAAVASPDRVVDLWVE